MTKLLFLYFLIINLAAFIMYGIDKRKAIKKKWRIPENMLISIVLIGGGIGAELGMHIFRHKTKHKKFTIGVPAIVVIQAVIFVLVLKARL